MRLFKHPRQTLALAALLVIAGIGTTLSQEQSPNQGLESGSESTIASDNRPAVAVCVLGDMPTNEKKVLGTYLITSLINSGKCVEANDAAAFVTAVNGEQSTRKGIIDEAMVCELGKQFNIKYVCIATVTPAFGFFTVSARIVHTGTGKVFFSGEAPSPLKTMEEITQVSNRVVENMFGIRIFGVPTKSAQEPRAGTISTVEKKAPERVPQYLTREEQAKLGLSGSDYSPKAVHRSASVSTPCRYVSMERYDEHNGVMRYYNPNGKEITDMKAINAYLKERAYANAYTKKHDERCPPEDERDTTPQPKYSLGIRQDNNQTEAYVRIFGENMRGYFGFMYSYYSGGLRAYKLSGFAEWRSNGETFYIYGGPGFALGIYTLSVPNSSYNSNYNYNYNYDYRYDDSRQSGDNSGMGIFIGAQIGVELKWGALAVGANLRLGYAYNGASKEGTFDYAIGAGPSYVKRKLPNE